MKLRTGMVVVGALVGASLLAVGAPGGSPPTRAATTGFVGVVPARLLDTRPGTTTIDNTFTGGGRIGPDTTLTLPITGRGTIPATGVGAVALNVTAVDPDTTSFITAHPTGTPRPNASNLNTAPGRTLPNMVIVPIGTNGTIDLYNAFGTTHLLVDILGWFPTGEGPDPTPPTTTAPGPTTTTIPSTTTTTEPPPSPDTLLVSRALDRQGHGGASNRPVISRDGRFVAFGSTHSNLVPADTNGLEDVFVAELATQQITRVSVGPSGSQLTAASARPSISSDGRFVVYLTAAAIDASDTNGTVDAYRFDRQTSTAVLVSRLDDESIFAADVLSAGVDGDGSTVAFDAPHPATGLVQVFVRQIAAATTAQASLGFTNYQNTGFGSSISADGDKVVFTKAATASSDRGVFRYDVSANTMAAMIATPSVAAAQQRHDPVVSDDGIGVAWVVGSTSATIEFVGTPGGTPTRIDVNDGGTGAGGARLPAFVPGTRDVLFATSASLEPEDTDGGAPDVYRRTIATPAHTDLVSAVPVGPNQQDGNGGSDAPAGATAGVVVFLSNATNLTTDLPSEPTFRVLVRVGSAQPVTVDRPLTAVTAHGRSNGGSLSANGRFAAFVSTAADVASGDTNAKSDAFRLDRDTGTMIRLSQSATGVELVGPTSRVDLNANGDKAVFLAQDAVDTSNHGSVGAPGSTQAYVRDVGTGSVVMVSLPIGTTATVGNFVLDARIADGGGFVIFSSLATNLVAGDTNGRPDVFVRNLATDAVERVNVSTAGAQSVTSTSAEAPEVDISADGRFVAWSSFATNLDPAATTAVRRVYWRDRQTGVTQLVGEGQNPSISADGRLVAFDSNRADLVPGDTNGIPDVFVKDIPSDTISRFAHDAPGNLQNSEPLLSADGTTVAFTTKVATVFHTVVADIATGQMAVAGVSAGGAPHNGTNALPTAIDADGSHVVFTTDASNLVAGDDNVDIDVFVRLNPL